MRNFWIACLVLVICRLLTAYILPTFDDAFITYRYAYNLAMGNGLVYNIGEKVMGTTAPLFAVIASLPVWLGIPVPVFFLLFNLCCDLGILFLMYRYFFKGEYASFFFLFVCLFAADPMISRISVGGMEADLFLMMSLTGLLLYVKGKKNAAAVLLASCYFLRPEAVILLFIVFCYDWYSTKKLPLVQALIGICVLAIPLLAIYSYYGQVLPQSVVAKSTFTRTPVSYLLNSIFLPDPLFWFLIPFAVICLFRYFKKDLLPRLCGAWMILYSLAYLIKGPHVWSWYFFSIQVMLILFACYGIKILIGYLGKTTTIKPLLGYVLLVVPVIVWMVILLNKGRSGVEKNIYEALQSDFKDSAGMADKLIFADDIGAIGYFTHARIYDNQKLVTPEAAQFSNAYKRITHVWPDYLFLYCDPTYLKLIQDNKLLSDKYHFVKRYAIGGQQGYPDIQTLNNSFKQDYMLFKRND